VEGETIKDLKNYDFIMQYSLHVYNFQSLGAEFLLRC